MYISSMTNMKSANETSEITPATRRHFAEQGCDVIPHAGGAGVPPGGWRFALSCEGGLILVRRR